MEDDVWTWLSKILSAMAHPTRLKILALCSEKERTRKELREALKISKPLLLAHLKILKSAGFIEERTIIDEERLVIKRLCRTRDFEIKLSPEFFRKLLQKPDKRPGLN